MTCRGEQIEEIMQLMTKYRVDLVEVEGIKVVMTRHAPPAPPPKSKKDDDEGDVELARAELLDFARGG